MLIFSKGVTLGRLREGQSKGVTVIQVGVAGEKKPSKTHDGLFREIRQKKLLV
jgi:hypothetical protein